MGVAFTFWAVSDSDGTQFFLLTPASMVGRIPDKYPGARAMLSVEASTIHEAELQMAGRLGWGPFRPSA
jgi:hypothetical protein